MTKTLVVTDDVVGERMAGPAMRAVAIARRLAARGHEVRLISTVDCTIEIPGLDARVCPAAKILDHEPWADVIVYQGVLLSAQPRLGATDAILVADLYDPVHLEALEQSKELPTDADRHELLINIKEMLDVQLGRGDFFLCASEKQRDLWLGHLAEVGRINPLNYDGDPSLRSLIDVAPFGVDERPPQRTGPGVRGVIAGIGERDRILVWGGGVYNWFDPLTLVRAVDVLRSAHPDLRLYFMGLRHPNPNVKPMEMATSTMRLATELGLTGRHVFFNESWIPYDERQNVLLDADIAVTTHFDHVETAFSFRTRVLDYLWCGLPVVCTAGDAMADAVTSAGAGVSVTSEDVGALAAALDSMLRDDSARSAAATASGDLARTFHWNDALGPLLRFCDDPHRAADLIDPATVARVARWGMQAPPRTRLEAEARIAFDHLERGGWRLVMRKASDRARRSIRRRASTRLGRRSTA